MNRLLLCGVLLAFAGCDGLGPLPQHAELAGEWVLVHPEFGDTRSRTASFGEGGVEGSAGCNYYGAGVEARGTRSGPIRITIGPITRIWCGQQIMANESTYLALLGNAESFEVRGSELVILSSGIPLRYTRR